MLVLGYRYEKSYSYLNWYRRIYFKLWFEGGKAILNKLRKLFIDLGYKCQNNIFGNLNMNFTKITSRFSLSNKRLKLFRVK